jgi:hypothetical protein
LAEPLERSSLLSRYLCCRKFRANIKVKGTKIALGAYFNEVDAAKVTSLRKKFAQFLNTRK